MTHSKGFLLIVGVLFCFAAIGQNDTIIKKGFVNFATLILDFETYEFEGGNMAYYECADCDNQSIPFLIDYQSPGDFGGITFHLEPTMDVLFDATIIWAGTGQIDYPTVFDFMPPFNYNETPISEPVDILYLDADGEELDDEYLLMKVQSVWDAVDSLQITNLFAEKDYKAVIYFYPPTVGAVNPKVAKWIVFLYYSDMTSSINSYEGEMHEIEVFPNPVRDILHVKLIEPKSDVVIQYRILDASGAVVNKGRLDSEAQQIDISEVTAGLYYIEFRDRAGTLVGSEKFVRE